MQRIVHANQVITYRFLSMADLPIAAHVSTRHGGVSPTPWASLNFSVGRGDTPQRVQENFARFCTAAGVDPNQVVRCRQVHGTAVAQVTWADAGQWQPERDGLVTAAVGLPLALIFADCVPLLLYDPQRHVLGVCHAGWRGTVDRVANATLQAMVAAFGTDPHQVRAAIGPSIGPQSYQVGMEVLEQARTRLQGAERFFFYPNGASDPRPHFDLWRANATQLAEAGVPPAQIEVAGIDTAQYTHDFFSHRAEQGRCGHFSMMAWLRPRR